MEKYGKCVKTEQEGKLTRSQINVEHSSPRTDAPKANLRPCQTSLMEIFGENKQSTWIQ